VVLSPVVIFLMGWMFQIPLWASLLAIPLAIVMGFVAARVTGETDITPTKALGPVTQLVYGVITPGNLSGNIMAANVTGGIGLHAADLLTTLKTGWLLGASPRVQFFAQLFGVLAGAAVVIPAFNILIPDPSTLGSDAWPAPACLVWAGVSKAFSTGIGSLHPSARTGILAGSLLGVALALHERFAPKKVKHLVPSPAGMGIRWSSPATRSRCPRRWPPDSQEALSRLADRYVPVASGFIAGRAHGVAVAPSRGWGPLEIARFRLSDRWRIRPSQTKEVS
jgi:uncharacterized oligopeptide transporter (OPT) family protein